VVGKVMKGQSPYLFAGLVGIKLDIVLSMKKISGTRNFLKKYQKILKIILEKGLCLIN